MQDDALFIQKMEDIITAIREADIRASALVCMGARFSAGNAGWSSREIPDRLIRQRDGRVPHP